MTRAVSKTCPRASTRTVLTPGVRVSRSSMSVRNRPEAVSRGKKALRGGTASPASMSSRATGPNMVQVVSTKLTFPDKSSRRTTTGQVPASWNRGGSSKDTPTSWASLRTVMKVSGPGSSSSPSTGARARASGGVVSTWRTMAIRGPADPATSTTASPGFFQSIFPVSKHQRPSPPSRIRAEAGGHSPVSSHTVRGRTSRYSSQKAPKGTATSSNSPISSSQGHRVLWVCRSCSSTAAPP